MVRAARIWPDVYFGKPGALVSLPYPRGDVDKPYEKLVYDFTTGAGQHMVSSTPLGSRIFTLNWKSMHVDNFANIEAYWNGMMGPGPWVFLDPSTRNLLLPNQASATGLFNDASNWGTSTGLANSGTVLSNATASFIHRARGTRSLRWQFTVATVTRPTLTASSPYRNWVSFPVVPGLPYSYSAWVRADGVVETSIGMNIRIRWMDAAGAFISDSSNPVPLSYTTVTSTWVQLSVNGTAPVGAVYGAPGIVCDDATVTIGGSVYVDEPIFEQDSVINSWTTGTGLRPVEIMSLSETSPFDARWRTGISLTLRELPV